jgi:hypothetical protein
MNCLHAGKVQNDILRLLELVLSRKVHDWPQ